MFETGPITYWKSEAASLAAILLVLSSSVGFIYIPLFIHESLLNQHRRFDVSVVPGRPPVILSQRPFLVCGLL